MSTDLAPATVVARDAPTRTQRTDRAHPLEGRLLFATALTGYLVLAVVLLSHDVVFPDSVSRVANGYYVGFSRDPHLPAVGFVWNPLPSLVLLPLLVFHDLVPALTRDGLAGGIGSAVFAAGAVVLVASTLRRMGLGRTPRLLLTAAFAAHPMILLYAGSGQSEAALLFFLLLAVRALLDWLATPRPQALVVVGIALGLAYWTRYEAVAPGLAVPLLVGAVTLVRQRTRTRRERLLTAGNDVALAGLPVVFAFATWAVSSKVLVGSWFATFSSDYGNSAQVDAQGSFIDAVVGNAAPARLGYALRQLSGLEPLLAVLLAAALLLALRRRDARVLGLLAVLGSVLLFNDVALAAGSSFGWLRFQITAVPLAVLAAGLLAAPQPQRTRTSRARDLSISSPARPQQRGVVATAVALAMIGLPVAGLTLADHRLAREETLTALAAWRPSDATADDRAHLHFYDTDADVAALLDRMRLPEGSVLTDGANAYDVVLRSARPRQFVITSDRDFAEVLRDPAASGVRYLLVAGGPAAPADALERAYPGLWETGAGAGQLVSDRPGVHVHWRLYSAS